MSLDRADKMGARAGMAGIIDRLRYHEVSRQGIGLLLCLVCAWFAEPGYLRVIAGFAMAAIGQMWRIYAAGLIYKNRELATGGAYAVVRHPLYLGNFLILVGFAIACFNWVVMAVVALFFLFYYPAAIRYEDSKLERIFEDAWRDWSKSVPAMFPLKFTGKSSVSMEKPSWNMRQSLLRNGELIISVYLVGCAAWLWFRATG